MLDKWIIIIRRKRYWPWRVDISFFVNKKTALHLLPKWIAAWSNARMKRVYFLCLGGALGGATVSLYQNGGCDEPLQMRLARSPQRSLHRPDLFPHTRHMICSRVLWTFKPLSRSMSRLSAYCRVKLQFKRVSGLFWRICTCVFVKY